MTRNEATAAIESHVKECVLCQAIDDAILSDYGADFGDCAEGARLTRAYWASS